MYYWKQNESLENKSRIAGDHGTYSYTLDAMLIIHCFVSRCEMFLIFVDFWAYWFHVFKRWDICAGSFISDTEIRNNEVETKTRLHGHYPTFWPQMSSQLWVNLPKTMFTSKKFPFPRYLIYTRNKHSIHLSTDFVADIMTHHGQKQWFYKAGLGTCKLTA